MTLWLAIGLGWSLVAVLMTVLWALHFPLRNAAIVDVGWSAGIPVVGLVHVLASGTGAPLAWAMLAATTLWGARLSLYLYRTRVHGGVPEEGRYRQLRKDWGAAFAGRLFGFFQAQGALDVLFALPLLLVAWDANAGTSPLAWAGLALWLVGFLGEGLADWQLHRFKADPANQGQVCQAGLWAYSRHPNYFFELLVWVAFALVATPSPWGWLAWICPAAMAFFLFRVTGIPATEAQALRSKGDAYREYQRTTSAFVPWFRKVA